MFFRFRPLNLIKSTLLQRPPHLNMATSDDRVPATSDTLTQPLFRNIDASNVEELETSELESLCLECGQNVSIVVIVHNYDEYAHIIMH